MTLLVVQRFHCLPPPGSENSPEQRRRVSPRSSPQPSPVTSPREHKIFGLFSKKKDKKAAQGQTVGDTNCKLISFAFLNLIFNVDFKLMENSILMPSYAS